MPAAASLRVAPVGPLSNLDEGLPAFSRSCANGFSNSAWRSRNRLASYGVNGLRAVFSSPVQNPYTGPVAAPPVLRRSSWGGGCPLVSGSPIGTV